MGLMEQSKALRDSGVTINAMHPGGVRTSIGSNNGWLYRTWMKWIILPTLKDPSISGEAIHYLGTASALSGVTGRFFNLTIEEKPMPHVFDVEAAKEIWRLSHVLTGLDMPAVHD